MDVMGLEKDGLVNGIEVGGVITFLEFDKDADVILTF